MLFSHLYGDSYEEIEALTHREQSVLFPGRSRLRNWHRVWALFEKHRAEPELHAWNGPHTMTTKALGLDLFVVVVVVVCHYSPKTVNLVPFLNWALLKPSQCRNTEHQKSPFQPQNDCWSSPWEQRLNTAQRKAYKEGERWIIYLKLSVWFHGQRGQEEGCSQCFCLSSIIYQLHENTLILPLRWQHLCMSWPWCVDSNSPITVSLVPFPK